VNLKSQISNLKFQTKSILGLTWSPFLHAPALGRPRKESRESFALAPNKPAKFRGPQRVHVAAEKRFEAPANVRTGPRTQPVTLCRDPVVAERSKHRAG